MVVVSGSVADRNSFRRGDLHVVHVLPVPDGLEYPVAKSEHQDILHRLLTQVMVYPVYLFFIEYVMHRPVQGLSGLQVMPKGFFDHHPAPSSLVSP